MNTGQMSMMPVNAGVPAPGTAQPASPATALPDSGDQGGGLFAGLLGGMTPRNSLPGMTAPVSDGKDGSPSEKNGGTVSATALTDDVSGVLAGLLEALDGTGKPLATGTEHAAGAGTTPGAVKKPQDVALNADGLQMALLLQANNGRMPQANDPAGEQATPGADASSASATQGSHEAPAPLDASDGKAQDVPLNTDGTLAALMIQANSGRMPQTADASVVAPLPGNSSVPGIVAAAGDADGPLQGLPADPSKMDAPHQASQKEPDRTALSAQQVSANAGQKNPAAGSGVVSTERGTASSGQNAGESIAGAPVSPSAGSTGETQARTAAPAGVEVTAQPQQDVPLFRSASLEVALAESASRNGAGTPGQAQDAPVTEISAASAEKAPSSPQNVRSATAGQMPAPAALSQASSQQPDQPASIGGRTTPDVTRPVQAAGAPAAEKAGAEAVQTRPESTAAAKPVQSVAVEAVKLAGAGSSGAEFSTDDDKGSADSFMNGQFHATLMHQQGSGDATSAVNTVSAPVQTTAPESALPEQIMQQVKDRLVNHEVKAGNEQIVLKLSPENLGDLKLNLTMDGQRLKVEIVAESHMVRDALLQNSDSLKESLARQNISMESFDVTTNGRGAGNPGQGQQQSGWREFAQQKQQNAWLASGGYRLPDVATAPTRLAYQTPSQHTMVDLHF